MLSILLRGSVTAALLVAATVSAAEPIPAKAGGQFRAKQVIGTKILIKGDTAIGTVDDLVFDDAGNLDYMIVASEGKLVTVPFEAAKFDLEKRTASVTLTAEQYKSIPTYTVETYPTYYAPTYRTETYRYYGLTPRPLRLFDRR